MDMPKPGDLLVVTTAEGTQRLRCTSEPEPTEDGGWSYSVELVSPR